MKPDIALAKQNLASAVIIFLTVTALVLLPGFTSIAKNFIYLLDILALGYLIRFHKDLGSFGKLERAFFIVIILNFFWIAFTYYINGSSGREETFVWNRQLFLLFLIPLYLLYRRVRISPTVLLLAFALSVLASFGVALVDISEYESFRYQDRAHGGMHPIEFGSMLLVMAGYLVYSAIYLSHGYIKVLSIIVAVVALVVIVWTQSRGVWAALPAIPFLSIVFTTRNWKLGNRLALLGVCLAVISASYFVPVVKNRVDVTVENVQKYLTSSGSSDEARESSLGGRFEMWKAGWHIFLEHPLTGVGIGRFQEFAQEYADKHQLNPSAYRFYHAHNQYISALATRGLPGFLLILALTIIPIAIALQSFNRESGNRRLSAITTLTISVSFAIFGLTDNPYESKPLILFFSIVMALLLSSLDDARDKQTTVTSSGKTDQT